MFKKMEFFSCNNLFFILTNLVILISINIILILIINTDLRIFSIYKFIYKLKNEEKKHDVVTVNNVSKGNANANADGDDGNGKDNRPWYKKKRYMIPLAIVLGGTAYYYQNEIIFVIEWIIKKITGDDSGSTGTDTWLWKKPNKAGSSELPIKILDDDEYAELMEALAQRDMEKLVKLKQILSQIQKSDEDL
jgi:hypothetical protein